MNNKTFTILRGKKAYCGRKPLSKQTGGINKLALIMIIGAVGYGAYIAKNKGLISIDKATSLVSSVSSKFSTNQNFSGYGVQLMATQQLDQAKTVMNDFARDGYSAFVLASQSKGRTYYKVRLGPYNQKPEALAIRDKVVQRYPQNPYVKSSLVIYKPN
jgi:hypothetical protein